MSFDRGYRDKQNLNQVIYISIIYSLIKFLCILTPVLLNKISFDVSSLIKYSQDIYLILINVYQK